MQKESGSGFCNVKIQIIISLIFCDFELFAGRFYELWELIFFFFCI